MVTICVTVFYPHVQVTGSRQALLMDAALRNMVGYTIAEWSHYDDMPTVHHTKQIHVYLKELLYN